MHSADYAIARCLSVCHMPVLSPNGYTYCIPSSSPTILVFAHQTGWQYSYGNPFNGGVERKEGMKKIMIFDQYLALSRKVTLYFDAEYLING